MRSLRDRIPGLVYTLLCRRQGERWRGKYKPFYSLSRRTDFFYLIHAHMFVIWTESVRQYAAPNLDQKLTTLHPFWIHQKKSERARARDRERDTFIRYRGWAEGGKFGPTHAPIETRKRANHKFSNKSNKPFVCRYTKQKILSNRKRENRKKKTYVDPIIYSFFCFSRQRHRSTLTADYEQLAHWSTGRPLSGLLDWTHLISTFRMNGMYSCSSARRIIYVQFAQKYIRRHKQTKSYL